MAEVKIQLVQRDEETVLIDVEPPITEDQARFIRLAPALYDIPDEALEFRHLTPDEGNPFTEINCAKIRAGLEGKGLILDEQNLARQIGEILSERGDTVKLEPGIKPIEQRGYRFLGLTPHSPPEESLGGPEQNRLF